MMRGLREWSAATSSPRIVRIASVATDTLGHNEFAAIGASANSLCVRIG